MLHFFLKTSAFLFVLGILLLFSSFIFDVSFWYGIGIVNSGIYLLLIGLFLYLMELNKPMDT
ncbi:MAG: hypothetical protein C0P75_003920 [Bacilli bacterium]|uniref:Uncharacterized protein n=1 Tax=Ureibacillus suwonensis TaxID=313007 RepID=A0ABW0RA75_9BACL|nr:hypothetical protein [Bacilli bacterium]